MTHVSNKSAVDKYLLVYYNLLFYVIMLSTYPHCVLAQSARG